VKCVKNINWKTKAKRRINWIERVACIEDNRKPYRVLMVKREGNKPLGGTRRIWGDNIILNFKEI
jgi:hypothetical protein